MMDGLILRFNSIRLNRINIVWIEDRLLFRIIPFSCFQLNPQGATELDETTVQ